jgi:hypothetical protein
MLMLVDLVWWFVEPGGLVLLDDVLHLVGITSFCELDDRPGKCWRRRCS